MSRSFLSGFAEVGKVWGLIILIVVLGFYATYQFVEPPPPKTLKIATGGKDGAYYAFAQEYASRLARDGITLDVVSTAGSVENLELLKKGEVSLALVQGGTATDGDKKLLQSMGALFLEPVWVFSRKQNTIEGLSQLKGKRVAVGVPGSGTHLLATALLAADGITEAEATLISEGSASALPWLAEGKIDAAFIVASPQARVVRELLEDSTLVPFHFRRLTAYTHRFPFLSAVTLSEGVLDLRQNIPPRDTQLLAAAANMVARDDLNSSLIPALLETLTRVHEKGGVLEAKRQFPSVDLVDLPINDDARRYILNGPSFLYRWLPYGTAVFLDRVKIMVLPFLALLIPLFRVAPPLYRWRVRAKIYRWYAAVREIDTLVQQGAHPENVAAATKKLKQLECDVASISVPLSYAGELYHLRAHIGFIAQELERLSRQQPQDS